jgi:lipoprotein-releasing system permease protein
VKYQLFIALRYLRAKHKQVFTSVITVISIIGIAIGVMALVVALSLMTGMHDEIRDKILGSRAHVTLYAGSSERTIRNFEQVREKILNVDGVTGAAPLVRETGMLMGRLGNHGVVVHGVDPHKSNDVIDVFNHITAGDWRDMTKELGEFRRRGILIGMELARDLGARVGDDLILLTISSMEMSPFGMKPKMLKLRVAGIFDTGDWQADTIFCYVPLDYLQSTLKLGEGITMMQVRIREIFEASEIKQKLEDVVGEYYLYTTWIEENTMFFEALQLEKLAMFLTITLIITVAALNIISTLIMLVMEKNRDIGVLMSMGASSGGVMSAFMLQGFIIGIIGTLIGSVLGASLSALLDFYEVIKLPGEVYTITSVRFKIIPGDIVLVSAVALFISLVATIYPAWKASRLRPAEALRYE